MCLCVCGIKVENDLSYNGVVLKCGIVRILLVKQFLFISFENGTVMLTTYGENPQSGTGKP